MESNKKIARQAGFLYLLMALIYVFSLGYVPGRFLIEGDAVATINNIAAAEWMFRLGIAAGMIACAIYMMQVLVLYKLLGPVNRNIAVLFVAVSLAHLPLFFTGHVDQLNLLSLLHENRYGKVLSTEQLHAQVMLFTDAYKNSVRVNELFMGLWLVPFGYLVFKSGFLPRIIGILLMLNSLPYLIDFFRQILAPGYALPSFIHYILMPGGMGEPVTILWLLIVGAKDSHEKTASATPA